MKPKPSIHAVVYGESGAGKSTFAATWPKPMLVLAFDPLGKDMPYIKTGKAGELVELSPGIFTQAVMSPAGDLRVQIEHYTDPEPTNPQAFGHFLTRMGGIYQELELWNTIVLDSVTFLELAARKDQQHRMNKNARDPRQWWAAATDQLEELLMMRFGSFPCNLAVIAHVDEDKDEVHGNFVRNPAAPGRVRKRLASAFGEVYRAFVQEDEESRIYLLQTRVSALFNCSTQIGAPEPCPQKFSSVWVGYNKNAEKEETE